MSYSCTRGNNPAVFRPKITIILSSTMVAVCPVTATGSEEFKRGLLHSLEFVSNIDSLFKIV